MPRPHFPPAGLAALVCLLLAPAAAPAQTGDPVIAAAGDIACDPEGASFNAGEGTADRCRQKHTAARIGNDIAAVLALGDNQYEEGTLSQFQGSYDLSWGQFKPITRPVIGNHEYRPDPVTGDTTGTGYWDYYNGVGVATGPAGERGKGWYSLDVGGWHLIALNSMCDQVAGGCGPGSEQEQWLRADLAANADAPCTLGYWHHPLFNSGPEGSYADTPWNTTALWQALWEYGADLVLTAHSHVYERFAPQDAQGNADPRYGLRQFIVGTGGVSLGNNSEVQPNSELRDNTHFGVIRLGLHPSGYDWTFVSDAGKTIDSGSGACHGAPDLTPPETSISSGPEGVVAQRNASFAFASSETPSSFRCRLDGPEGAVANEGPCRSRQTYLALVDGAYTLSVYATDESGNADATPATRSFTVDTTPPPVYHPKRYKLRSGDAYRNRGGIRRLRNNDGRRLEIAADAKRARRFVAGFQAVMSIERHQLATLRRLTLGYNGNANRRGVGIAVRIFNFRTRRWVKVHRARTRRRDSSFEWARSRSAARFASSKGRVRIRLKAKGPAEFRTRTDLLSLTVEY